MDEPEYSAAASERSSENAYYKHYCFIQVTCNINAKGQTWNENIWTVLRPKEKSQNWLSEVGQRAVVQTYKASKHAFSDINRNRKLGRSPYAGVATGLLKTPRTQLEKQAKMTQHSYLSYTYSKAQLFHILNTEYHDIILILQLYNDKTKHT